jgi:hypothetical protein
VRTYRHLFVAQVLSLVGSGLATVALALLAYDLAGNDAGDLDGQAVWKRVLKAVDELLSEEPPEGAKVQ